MYFDDSLAEFGVTKGRLRLSDRALILFLSFCKLSEVLKYIYMSNKNRERHVVINVLM